MERLRWPGVLLVLGMLAALHLQAHRREARATTDPALVRGEGLRSGRLRVEPTPEGLNHLLVLTFGPAAASRQELAFGRVPRIVAGPQGVTKTGEDVPLVVERRAEETRVAFDLPPADAAGAREVALVFATERPAPTYGWGFRALPVPWATKIVPQGAPFQVEAKVEGATTVSDWRCVQEGEEHLCVAQPRHRRALGIPLGPHGDGSLRVVFALAIGAAVSVTMWAIYRRWASLAIEMGLRDDLAGAIEAPTTEEWIAAQRRARASGARPASPGDGDDGDPLEVAALVARGVTAVLGIVASIFLVSWFGSGLLPIPARLALAIWAAVAGAIVVLAVGIDRPRPWHALAALVVLGMAAFAPQARWILPGLGPLAAAILMQLTAPTKPAR